MKISANKKILFITVIILSLLFAPINYSFVQVKGNFAGSYSSAKEKMAWYVRPAGENYGSGNGFGYGNAWSGLDKIIWGPGGVEAGDTLYICGTHIRTAVSNNYLASQGIFSPGVSGAAENPVVIDGGCPEESANAVIWGAWKDERPGGIKAENWTVASSPGVYYNETLIYNKAFDSLGLYEDIDGLNYKKYAKLDSVEAVGASVQNGVYYTEDFGENQHKIWLRPFNESTFKENIRWSGAAGWKLLLSKNNSYIEFRILSFLAGNINHEESSAAAGPYHDYTFKNCKFFSFGATFIYTPWNSYNFVFDGCEFAYANNGVYALSTHGVITNFKIKNSYFHDIGKSYGTSPDGHCIAWQGNEYLYVENNEFARCGSAISFHVWPNETQKHIYIIGNYIHNMLAGEGIDHGSGIVLSGSNDNLKENTGDFIIKNNIITDCEGQGIVSNRKSAVEIYNNSVQGATSYYLAGMREDGASAKFYNNISLNPRPYNNVYNPDHWTNGKPYHFFFNQNAPEIAYDFEADNNLYYPNAENDNSFFFLNAGIAANAGSTFSAWKINHQNSGGIADENSLAGNPFLINASNNYSTAADFGLRWDSPAIDAGADLAPKTAYRGQGYDSDYFNNPIYGAPDIGAVEYQPPYVMETDKPDIGADIRVYGDGKFRNKKNPSGETASLSIIPHGGTARQWIDVAIAVWNKSGGYEKKWSESSPNLDSTAIARAIGDLAPGKTYAVYCAKDGKKAAKVLAQQADSSGKIVFDYGQNYSEAVFEIEEDIPQASAADSSSSASDAVESKSNRIINVNGISELNNAVANAQAGDTIILADGIYKNQGAINLDCRNANPAPSLGSEIIVRAETPGGAIITGKSSAVNIMGDYLAVSGFYFKDIAGDGVLMSIMDAEHWRITNCKFENINKTGGVVEVRGLSADASVYYGPSRYGRLDHCVFENNRRIEIENFIVDESRYAQADLENKYNRYDHNIFRNHIASSQEEAFQIGRGSEAWADNTRGFLSEFATDAHITVEYNIFENYNGDNEIISSKSSSNIIRYNVIKNCDGAIALRGGDNSIVEGNYFLAEQGIAGEKYYKGITVYGSGHKIINNYIEGFPAAGHGQIFLHKGNGFNKPSVENVLIANNSIKDSKYGVFIEAPDKAYHEAAKNCAIINNIAESAADGGGSVMFNGGGTGNFWAGNISRCPDCSIGNNGVDSAITSGVLTSEKHILADRNTGHIINWRDPASYIKGVFNIDVVDDIAGRLRANPPAIGCSEGGEIISRSQADENSAGVDWSDTAVLEEITNLTAENTANNSASLSRPASGDNGNRSAADGYSAGYSASPITEAQSASESVSPDFSAVDPIDFFPLNERGYFNGINNGDIKKNSNREAEAVLNHNQFVDLDQTTLPLYQEVMAKAGQNIDLKFRYAIAYFIHYGAPVAQKLDASKRAGVVGSYLLEHGRLPETISGWEEIIQVAAGKSAAKESQESDNSGQSLLQCGRDNLYGLDGIEADAVIGCEAEIVLNYNQFVDLDQTALLLYQEIMAKAGQSIDLQFRYAVAYFINYGSETTRRLGSGERAGAVGSVIAAYGKLPSAVEDWQDVIKIANGRWPNAKSGRAESKAKDEFKKIYRRAPEMDNANDSNAVMIMAYGLRPVNRNFDSEKMAIAVFKKVYGYNPVGASNWNIVRAISYSGAKK